MLFISVLIGFIAGLIVIMFALRAIAESLVVVVGLLGFFLVYAVVEHMAFGFFSYSCFRFCGRWYSGCLMFAFIAVYFLFREDRRIQERSEVIRMQGVTKLSRKEAVMFSCFF